MSALAQELVVLEEVARDATGRDLPPKPKSDAERPGETHHGLGTHGRIAASTRNRDGSHRVLIDYAKELREYRRQTNSKDDPVKAGMTGLVLFRDAQAFTIESASQGHAVATIPRTVSPRGIERGDLVIINPFDGYRDIIVDKARSNHATPGHGGR